MEESNTSQMTGQPPVTDRETPTARRSGGPRTPEGKRRSCQNARRHGLYTDESFLEGAALELGEDPRQFQRLLKGLIEARRPVGALELAVVEDIALLLMKKARLDKAELAVQVSNLHQHDLERRKQMIQVGDNDSNATGFDVRENGLRRFLDCPGKYEQVLNLLGSLLAMIDMNEFGYRMTEALRTLYGTEHTLRGAEIDTLRYKLSHTEPQDESFGPAKKAMTTLVAKETAAVERQYELFLEEHVANTRAARVAATAPSHAQWAAIIRQQNSLQRQMERKIRLLMELQRERRELEAAPDGAASDPSPSYPSPSGVAHASRTPSSESMRASPQARQEPGANMPEGAGEADVPSLGMSAPVGFGAQNGEQPPLTPPYQGGESEAGPRLLEKFENRGNELKDLLQRQGITEIAASKRTAFARQNEAIDRPAAHETPGKTRSVSV